VFRIPLIGGTICPALSCRRHKITVSFRVGACSITDILKGPGLAEWAIVDRV